MALSAAMSALYTVLAMLVGASWCTRVVAWTLECVATLVARDVSGIRVGRLALLPPAAYDVEVTLRRVRPCRLSPACLLCAPTSRFAAQAGPSSSECQSWLHLSALHHRSSPRNSTPLALKAPVLVSHGGEGVCVCAGPRVRRGGAGGGAALTYATVHHACAAAASR